MSDSSVTVISLKVEVSVNVTSSPMSWKGDDNFGQGVGRGDNFLVNFFSLLQ